MFHLPPNAVKCLKEELQQNVPVTGEFEVSEAPGQTVDYVVSVDFHCSQKNKFYQTIIERDFIKYLDFVLGTRL